MGGPGPQVGVGLPQALAVSRPPPLTPSQVQCVFTDATTLAQLFPPCGTVLHKGQFSTKRLLLSNNQGLPVTADLAMSKAAPHPYRT